MLYTTGICLALKDADVGLIQIEPFTLEQAREYIAPTLSSSAVDSSRTIVTHGIFRPKTVMRHGLRLSSVHHCSTTRAATNAQPMASNTP